MTGKDFAVKNAWRNTLIAEKKRKRIDILDADITEAAKKAKDAVKLLRETISMNSSFELVEWITAFHVLTASAFYQTGSTYEDYCEHMEQAKALSKPVWD